MAEESLDLPRASLDDSSINLDDDLVVSTSDQSSTSVVYNPPNKTNNHNRIVSTSTMLRTSIDNESIFSSSAHVSAFNPDETKDDIYSPLGPNSIYELTIGSDLARIRRNRPPKSSVTINGGVNTVYNLSTPSTRDIPQIQLSKLKSKVTDADLYEKYVKNAEREYKQFESSYKLLTEDTLQKFQQQQQQRISASSSVEDIQIIDSISDIPKVFLDSNFRLDDPRIFKQVIEDTSILGESSLVNNTDLQDKLSNYLDIVEMNLIQEIGKSSDSFFNAIGDIEKIQIQSKSCVDIFNNITKELEELEQAQSNQGLKILHKLIEKKNVETFESTLIQIQYITSFFNLSNKSFTDGNYAKCLNEIVVVEKLLHGVRYQDVTDPDLKNLYPDLPNLVELTQLPAFIHLRNDLQSLKHECSKGYTDDFVELLTTDLRDHYRYVATKDTLNRLYVNKDKTKKYASRPVNTSYLNIEEEKKSKLKEYVRDLEKAGNLSEAYSTYQHRFITEIKDIIKQNLPSSQSQEMSQTSSRASPAPPDTGKPNALSTNIKTLTPREFENMFSKTCAELSECLRRLTAHQKLLLDVALTSTSSTNDIDIMSLDITTAIHKAIELTQIRLMKVISVRSEQTADLPVQFYLRLYSITSSYLQECEMINPGFAFGGAGNALGEWFSNHLTYFVHRFHINSIREMSTECTKEIWREVVDPKELAAAQSAIDELIGYTTGESGDKLNEYFDFYEDDEKQPQEQQVGQTIRKLSISTDVFLVPSLALKNVYHIRDYIVIAKAFPSFASTITNNLLNYFKVLNSKTSQAVLNAGATRTAGLKHITTKHLALCIQFVEFNIGLLEAIKNFFPQDTHQENPEEITYSRILSNYKDHETELFSKVVTMMHDRTMMRCAGLPKINWSEPIKHPQQCHSYMEDLVKDTITVAKVLTKYLPELKSSLILSQIFDNYKRLFVESYCTQLPPFKDINEKQNVLKDIDYFRVKLFDVGGYGNSGQVIWENVNSMTTEEEAKMEEIMRHNIQDEQKQRSPPLRPEAPARRFSFDRLVSSARSSFDRHRKEEALEPRSQSATANLEASEMMPEESKAEEEGEVIFDVTETSVEPELVQPSMDVQETSPEDASKQVEEERQDEVEKQAGEKNISEKKTPVESAVQKVEIEAKQEVSGVQDEENADAEADKELPEIQDKVEAEKELPEIQDENEKIEIEKVVSAAEEPTEEQDILLNPKKNFPIESEKVDEQEKKVLDTEISEDLKNEGSMELDEPTNSLPENEMVEKVVQYDSIEESKEEAKEEDQNEVIDGISEEPTKVDESNLGVIEVSEEIEPEEIVSDAKVISDEDVAVTTDEIKTQELKDQSDTRLEVPVESDINDIKEYEQPIEQSSNEPNTAEKQEIEEKVVEETVLEEQKNIKESTEENIKVIENEAGDERTSLEETSELDAVENELVEEESAKTNGVVTEPTNKPTGKKNQSKKKKKKNKKK